MNKHASKVYCCENCKYHSQDISNFKRHLRSNIHIENKKINKKPVDIKKVILYPCLECKKIYKSRDSLKYHKKYITKKIIK